MRAIEHSLEGQRCHRPQSYPYPPTCPYWGPACSRQTHRSLECKQVAGVEAECTPVRRPAQHWLQRTFWFLSGLPGVHDSDAGLLLNIPRFCPRSYVYSFFLSLCLQLIFITTYWNEDTNVEEGGFCLFLWGLSLALKCKQLKSQSHCFPVSPEISSQQKNVTSQWLLSIMEHINGAIPLVTMDQVYHFRFNFWMTRNLF